MNTLLSPIKRYNQLPAVFNNSQSNIKKHIFSKFQISHNGVQFEHRASLLAAEVFGDFIRIGQNLEKRSAEKPCWTTGRHVRHELSYRKPSVCPSQERTEVGSDDPIRFRLGPIDAEFGHGQPLDGVIEAFGLDGSHSGN